MLPADQLPVADLHHLEAGLVFGARHPDGVVLGAAEGGHLLLLHRPLDGPQLVARRGRLLVAQRLAVPGHVAPQLGCDRLLPSVEEVDDLANGLAVVPFSTAWMQGPCGG